MKEPLCTCCLEPVNDATEPSDLCSEATGTNDGIGWKIKRCPMHAAAPALYKALQTLNNYYAASGQVWEQARAALALVDAPVSPKGENEAKHAGLTLELSECKPEWGCGYSHSDECPRSAVPWRGAK